MIEETSDKLSEEDWETLKIVSDLLVFSLALNTPTNMTSMEPSLRSWTTLLKHLNQQRLHLIMYS